jgi:hypothetical protein
MLSQTSPRRLVSAETRLTVLQLRRSGKRYTDVAAEAGVSREVRAGHLEPMSVRIS